MLKVSNWTCGGQACEESRCSRAPKLRGWRRGLAGVTVAAVLVAIAACDSSPTLPRGSAVLRVGEGRKTVEVAMTGVVHVELLGNDGTGYDWRLAAIDRAFLEPAGVPHITPVDPGVRGGRTITTFEFRPLMQGRTQLVFELVRPWAPDPPGRVAEVEVVIGGGS